MNQFKCLNKKLNFLNNPEKTNIAKINVQPIDYTNMGITPILFKKYYEYWVE